MRGVSTAHDWRLVHQCCMRSSKALICSVCVAPTVSKAMSFDLEVGAAPIGMKRTRDRVEGVVDGLLEVNLNTGW